MPDLAPLLLDLDGTLVDTLADIAASANHVRALYGLPPLPAERVRGMVGDGVALLLRRTLSESESAASFDAASWEAALTRYRQHHVGQCTVNATPYPGVRERLAQWSAAGRAMAVVTNKPRAFAVRILEHLDLLKWLPVVVGGDCLPVRKPDPAPLREALDRLDVPRQPATMAGDGVQDLRAGKAAGLRTAAVLYGFRPESELRREGADEYWTAFGG